MKFVSCSKCGTKYQLEDNEDHYKFECSKCSGRLELVDSNEDISSNTKNESITKEEDDFKVVYCEDCDMRFVIDKGDIDTFICSNCYGKLNYLDSENEDYSKADIESISSSTNFDIDLEPKEDYIEVQSDKDYLMTIDMIDNNEEPEIIPLNQSKDQKLKVSISDVPKDDNSSDEEEFFEHMGHEDIPYQDSVKEVAVDELGQYDDEFGPKSFRTKKMDNKQIINRKSYTVPEDYPYIYIIWISLMFIALGIADIIITGRLYSLVFSSIFMVIFIIFIIKNQKWNKKVELENIVVESLSTLPLNYFILSGVKIPKTKNVIDHLIISSTGIFSIIIQKYSDSEEYPSNKKNIFGNEIYVNEEDDIFSEDYIKNIEKDSTIEAKSNSVEYAEYLYDYLTEREIEGIDIIPLVAFLNKNVAILNNPLSDEDIFLKEFLSYIKKQDVIMDDYSSYRCALALSAHAYRSDI